MSDVAANSSDVVLAIARCGPPTAFELRLQFELRRRLPLASLQFVPDSPRSPDSRWLAGAAVLVIPHEGPESGALARSALERGIPVAARTSGPIGAWIGGGGIALTPAASAGDLAGAAVSLAGDSAERTALRRRVLAQARRLAGREEARRESPDRDAPDRDAPGTLPGTVPLRTDAIRVVQRGPQSIRPVGYPETTCVVLCHNYGRYLPTCLESCLAQTVPFAQILVVDNHSSDDTPAVAERFRLRGVDYVCGNWSNFTAGRNAGAALAQPAEYLLFVDADNWLDSTFHERLRPALAENPVCAVSYPHLRLCDEGEGDLGLSPLIRAFDYDALRHANLADACALLRRSAWKEVGGWVHEPWGHTDWHLWLRLTRRGWQMQWAPEAILHYRVHPRAMSARLAGTAGAGLSVAKGAMVLCLILVLSGAPAAWDAAPARLALSSWRRENLTVIALSQGSQLARSAALGLEFNRMGVSYATVPADFPLLDFPFLDVQKVLSAVRRQLPRAADLVWLPLDAGTVEGDFLERIAGTLLNIPGVPCVAYRLTGTGCSAELGGILCRRPDWEALSPLPAEPPTPNGPSPALAVRLPEHTLECWLPPPEPSFPVPRNAPQQSTDARWLPAASVTRPSRKLSILLVLSRDLSQTKDCLRSLRDDLSPSSPWPAEILCVDDGASAGTLDWLRRQPDLTLLPPSHSHCRAAGYNEGFRLATGGVLCVLSNRTLIRPGGMQALAQAAAEVGISAQSGGTLIDEMRFAGRTGDPTCSDYPEATALAVRRDVWDRVGPFDEGMLLSGAEDADWGIRARALGYEWALLPDTLTVVDAADTLAVVGIADAQAHNHHRLLTRWGTRIRMLRR